MRDTAARSDFLPAARAALEQFPVANPTLELVAVSENVTFRVLSGDGGMFVLRLHRPGYNSLSELESERVWGNALRAAGIRVQHPLLSIQGQHFVRVPVEARNEYRFAGMTSWFPGVPMSERLEAGGDHAFRKSTFRRIGELAARIHNQSEIWRPPAAFSRARLDEDGLLGEMPRWGQFWEHRELTRPERDQLLRAREQCRAALRAYGLTSGNFSLIHADLHPENIIVQGEEPGLIDFDDAAYGWHGYELAAALIEYWDDDDFEELQGAVLDGYRQHRVFTRADEAMLSTFLLIRAMAIIGWFHQRREHADSEFFECIKAQALARCPR
ncbi:aminoglycoside phosphotransferase [gamma proteobacterium NOR5-3]|nr:aminoglycoside phosphotransferase [gamma proteobacterium NOR5-3]